MKLSRGIRALCLVLASAFVVAQGAEKTTPYAEFLTEFNQASARLTVEFASVVENKDIETLPEKDQKRLVELSLIYVQCLSQAYELLPEKYLKILDASFKRSRDVSEATNAVAREVQSDRQSGAFPESDFKAYQSSAAEVVTRCRRLADDRDSPINKEIDQLLGKAGDLSEERLKELEKRFGGSPN